MKKIIHYLGLDVHKNSIGVAIVRASEIFLDRSGRPEEDAHLDSTTGTAVELGSNPFSFQGRMSLPR